MKSLYVLPQACYIAVNHSSHPNICDACALQADCDELFGNKGERCEIHAKGYRWQKVSDDLLKELKILFNGLLK
jgi:hypothetical protein